MANLLGSALGSSNHPLRAVQLQNLHFPGSGQEGLEQEVPAAPQVQVRMTPVSQSSQPPAQGGSVLLGTDQMSPSPAPLPAAEGTGSAADPHHGSASELRSVSAPGFLIPAPWQRAQGSGCSLQGQQTGDRDIKATGPASSQHGAQSSRSDAHSSLRGMLVRIWG